MEIDLWDADWEAMHASYDQPTYQAVLDRLVPGEVVLDIGAGDLRLAREMAPRVRRVYAVEVDPAQLSRANGRPLPENLIPICADAVTLDFPAGITSGVLLMRHCTRFPLYAHKLRGAGANRLITNARWRMGVETVDLSAAGTPFAAAAMGWYACRCGCVGFKEGPAQRWTAEMDAITNEVSSCPRCMDNTVAF